MGGLIYVLISVVFVMDFLLLRYPVSSILVMGATFSSICIVYVIVISNSAVVACANLPILYEKMRKVIFPPPPQPNTHFSQF